MSHAPEPYKPELHQDEKYDKVIEVQTEKQFKSDPEKLRSYERIKALELAIMSATPGVRGIANTDEWVIKRASKFYQFLSGKDKAYYQPATQKQLDLIVKLDYRSYYENGDLDLNTLSRGEATEVIEMLKDQQPKDLDQQFKEHNDREK